jgi:hypothetical protein
VEVIWKHRSVHRNHENDFLISGMLQPTTSLMPLQLPLRLPENPCGQPHNRHQLRACQSV